MRFIKRYFNFREFIIKLGRIGDKKIEIYLINSDKSRLCVLKKKKERNFL